MEDNNSVFVNLYIEKILTEVTELTKSKLILQTTIAWNEKTIKEMTELQNKLQQAVNSLQDDLKDALNSADAPASKKKKKVFVEEDADTF